MPSAFTSRPPFSQPSPRAWAAPPTHQGHHPHAAVAHSYQSSDFQAARQRAPAENAAQVWKSKARAAARRAAVGAARRQAIQDGPRLGEEGQERHFRGARA